MTSFARICIWIVFVNFTILLSNWGQIKVKTCCFENDTFLSIMFNLPAWPATLPAKPLTKFYKHLTADKCMTSYFQLHAREEWKICIQKFAYRGSTTEEGPRTTAGAHLYGRCSQHKFKTRAPSQAVPLESSWQGKFLGMHTSLESSKWFYFWQRTIYSYSCSLIMFHLFQNQLHQMTVHKKKKKMQDPGSLRILSFLVSPSWKVCPDQTEQSFFE